ncbi:hypothetical protein Glove_13g89 [Diversispora epigaea]|uniref:Uncharacterized protein n=1 Tax=Diversispora epigaea TaxID=1348612 RepID=A0A397JWL7_9GLOM|nr:hypothetical protein Glove_13g89 [Diversispora epigaea]
MKNLEFSNLDNQIDSFLTKEDFEIEFDKEGYFCALNSIKDDETCVSDIESDIEPELLEILEESSYRTINQDSISKSTPCVLID